MTFRTGMYLLILCFIGAFVSRWLLNRRTAAAEFASLFDVNRQTRVHSITFSGQRRTLVLDDPETLALIENAFRDSRSKKPTLGIAYQAVFQFESGRSFKTFIYVHADGEGITIADPTVMHAGDPQTISIRIQPPIPEKLRRLFDDLSTRVVK